MLHFRGANAVGQRAEGPMGGGVGVATDNGHARQRQTQLGTDDVDNALARVIDRSEERRVGKEGAPGKATAAAASEGRNRREAGADDWVDVRAKRSTQR